MLDLNEALYYLMKRIGLTIHIHSDCSEIGKELSNFLYLTIHISGRNHYVTFIVVACLEQTKSLN